MDAQGDADAFAHMIAEVESWEQEDETHAAEPGSAPLAPTSADTLIGFDELDDMAPPCPPVAGTGFDLLDVFGSHPTTTSAQQPATEPTPAALGDFEDGAPAPEAAEQPSRACAGAASFESACAGTA